VRIAARPLGLARRRDLFCSCSSWNPPLDGAKVIEFGAAGRRAPSRSGTHPLEAKLPRGRAAEAVKEILPLARA